MMEKKKKNPGSGGGKNEKKKKIRYCASHRLYLYSTRCIIPDIL